MKTRQLKGLLYIPVLWFVTYIILITVGCISCLSGASDEYYCTIYCKVIVGLFVLANFAIVYLVFKSKK